MPYAIDTKAFSLKLTILKDYIKLKLYKNDNITAPKVPFRGFRGRGNLEIKFIEIKI